MISFHHEIISLFIAKTILQIPLFSPNYLNMRILSDNTATGCPLSFKTAHEDYYISRLESPWACDEEGSSLETIPINIVNSKDGKLMGLNSDTGAAEVSSDNILWTFRPSCDGVVELTNLGTGAILTTWIHDPEKMTFMDQETGKFAISTKRKGLKWMDIQYLVDWPWSNTPWGRYRWEIKRALLE